eukprot:TRINITY_DN845_c0_g4_i1.p1 TRINITY_DN845_c0_g4~~TRINITY_DN845_c0_g4_i1.p1  ORF type:complete len:419 (+),score=124.86 TRINITY_DN845_c0_g4_i1:858-2114(+)
MKRQTRGTSRKSYAEVDEDDDDLEESEGEEQEDEEEAGDSSSLKVTDLGNYVYVLDSADLKGSTKIASFDMDGTLIEPKSGRKFPTGRSDWRWWNDSVPTKLKSLYEQQYKIVIFTNQGGIEKGKQKRADITGKIQDLAAELGFPIQAFIAGAENNYRKPFTTMWELLESKYNKDEKIDMSASFYCGDAAGRKKDWKKGAKKDFSCSDRKFAANVGIKFYTPDEYFLEQAPVPFEWDGVNPATLIENAKPVDNKTYHSTSQEMVIMVGWPASGKSTFTERYFVPHGYVRVNRDTLKTKPKCQKAVKEAFNEGLSVVVDNTNPSESARGEFISIAQEKSIPVRCIYLKTPRDVAEHLNYVRVRETNGDVRRIPDVGYNTYNKNFEPPTKSEGFTEVIEVEFNPNFEGKPHLEKYFKHWT